MRGYGLLALIAATACVCAQDTSDSKSVDANAAAPFIGGLEQPQEIVSAVGACEDTSNKTCNNLVVQSDETVVTELIGSYTPTDLKRTVGVGDGASTDSSDRVHLLEKELAVTKSELADTALKLNDLLQEAKSLESKIERMQANHIKELNETFNELEAISRESDRSKRHFDQNEEKLKTARKQLSECESELRGLQNDAMNQYVNFTLIGNDLMEFAHDIVSSTILRFNNKFGRHSHRMQPKINRAKHQTKTKYGNAKKNVQKKATQMQRRMHRHWTRSTYVRPLFEATWGKVARYTFDVYHPYRPIVNDIKESLRLSSLSAIDVTSKGVLSYLDNHVKRKEERETRRRERDKEMAERHGRHHRPTPRKIPKDVRISAKGEVTVEPPYLHKKIRPFFQFMLEHKEGLVSEGAAIFPVFVAMYFGECILVGIVLYFIIGFPIELMWIFSAAKLIRRIRCQVAGKGKLSQ